MRLLEISFSREFMKAVSEQNLPPLTIATTEEDTTTCGRHSGPVENGVYTSGRRKSNSDAKIHTAAHDCIKTCTQRAGDGQPTRGYATYLYSQEGE